MKLARILDRGKASARKQSKSESNGKHALTENKSDKSSLQEISQSSPREPRPASSLYTPVGGHVRIVDKGPGNGDGDQWSQPHNSDNTGASTNRTGVTEQAHSLPPLQTTNEDETGDLAPIPEEAVGLDSFDLVPPAATGSHGEKPASYLDALERRAFLLFSKTHMRLVFEDFKLLKRFTSFLVENRPQSIPLLAYHLDVRKALAAIKYTNAISQSLKPLDSLDFTSRCPPKTSNEELERKLEASLEILANEDLAAWITATWMQTVEVSIRRRINGSLPTHLRDLSEGLAETFCLADPSRYDTPVIFASEEFNRMTQYNNRYVIGRNCRIFQGPRTNPHGVRRLREKLESGQEHFEPLVNYRRDGSPFMNLLMITPLLDAKGKVRYYLGAQIDVSGLSEDFYGFEYLKHHFDQEGSSGDDDDLGSSDYEGGNVGDHGLGKDGAKDELQELSEMLNRHELEVVRNYGGRMHHPDLHESPNAMWKAPRLVIPSSDDDGVNGNGENNDDHHFNGNGGGVAHGAASNYTAPWDTGGFEAGEWPQSDNNNNNYNYNHNNYNAKTKTNATKSRPENVDGMGTPLSDTPFSGSPVSSGGSFPAQRGGFLGGVYAHYLLVRPAPNLRILFASQSMRIPGMVQSNLMDRIGGSQQLRQEIEQALYRGQSVTAKVKWISNVRQQQSTGAARTKNRWLHATSLLGRNGEVGVWMVVLVDEEKDIFPRLPGPRSRDSSVRNSFDGRPGTSHSSIGSVLPGARGASVLSAGGDMEARDLGVEGLRSPLSRSSRRISSTHSSDLYD